MWYILMLSLPVYYYIMHCESLCILYILYLVQSSHYGTSFDHSDVQFFVLLSTTATGEYHLLMKTSVFVLEIPYRYSRSNNDWLYTDHGFFNSSVLAALIFSLQQCHMHTCKLCYAPCRPAS